MVSVIEEHTLKLLKGLKEEADKIEQEIGHERSEDRAMMLKLLHGQNELKRQLYVISMALAELKKNR